MLQKIKQLAAGLALAAPLLATAGPFSTMYVFGDSLVDAGNTVAILASQGLDRPFPFAGPYLGGRFSNGPLWVDGLAASLGLPPITTASAFFQGGNNFAFAGSQVSDPTLDGLPPALAQVIFNRQLLNPFVPGVAITSFDPNALFVVTAGGNDLRNALSAPGGATPLSIAQAAGHAVAGLYATVGYLAQHGAQHILISNLPDIGLTPEATLANFFNPGAKAAASAAAALFNAILDPLAPGFRSLGIDVQELDMWGIANRVLTNPAAYGITNLTLPCDGFAGSNGLGYIVFDPTNLSGNLFTGPDATACSASAFSDILHPSAIMHAAFAAEAFLLVPEPDGLALFGLALVGLVWSQRGKLVARAV